MNILSLFDGMSCGRIALERARVKVDNYFASEIDKYAQIVSQNNYPDIVRLGDVTKIKSEDLPKIDLLIGGSPCQGFSTLGKGLNFEDPKSKLFFEYVRILKEINPKYFLLENVIMGIKNVEIISSYLGVEPIMINSSLVSAQSRKRLYWTNIPKVQQPLDRKIELKNILSEKSDSVQIGQVRPVPRNYNALGIKRKNVLEIRKDFKSNCLSTTNDNILILDGNKKRKLIPLESERLQTLPDNYTEGVSNYQRYKMIGNGWTVDVIAHIFSYFSED